MHHKRQTSNRSLDTPDKRSRVLALFHPKYFFFRKEINIKRPAGSDILVTTLIGSHHCREFCNVDDLLPWVFVLVSSGAFVKYFWAA